jgi:prepilin-type N-terminal cleavage/methylation domain-containing protein
LTFASNPFRQKGLTLIELLVVIGIVAVLAGILYVALAPAREKARLTRCINNFRQIYLALESYRQDWDGVDVETANRFADLCLPPEPCWIYGSFLFHRVECIGGVEIWKCSTPLLKVAGSDYGYPITYHEDQKVAEYIDKKFRARRGEFPIVTDRNHDPDGGFAGGYFFVLMLRLNGKIETKRIVLPIGRPWSIYDE